MRPNWFIAFPIKAGNWYETVITKIPAGIKSFAPSDLHITFAFLGPCGEEKARLAWDSATRLHLKKTTITLDSLAPFGDPQKPSAYAFILEKGRGEVLESIKTHRHKLLQLAGKEFEKYKEVIPHVTIARPPRSASDELRAVGLEWVQQYPAIEVPLQITELALYTWADDRKERQFKMVESYKLI